MKTLKSSSGLLLLMGGIWLFYAIPWRRAHETAADSNAMQFEVALMEWANQHVSKEAVKEIFSDDGSLKLGGEAKDRNFRQMIRDTVADSSVPVWPGAFALITGLVSLLMVTVLRDRQAAKVTPAQPGRHPPSE